MNNHNSSIFNQLKSKIKHKLDQHTHKINTHRSLGQLESIKTVVKDQKKQKQTLIKDYFQEEKQTGLRNVKQNDRPMFYDILGGTVQKDRERGNTVQEGDKSTKVRVLDNKKPVFISLLDSDEEDHSQTNNLHIIDNTPLISKYNNYKDEVQILQKLEQPQLQQTTIKKQSLTLSKMTKSANESVAVRRQTILQQLAAAHSSKKQNKVNIWEQKFQNEQIQNAWLDRDRNGRIMNQLIAKSKKEEKPKIQSKKQLRKQNKEYFINSQSINEDKMSQTSGKQEMIYDTVNKIGNLSLCDSMEECYPINHQIDIKHSVSGDFVMEQESSSYFNWAELKDHKPQQKQQQQLNNQNCQQSDNVSSINAQSKQPRLAQASRSNQIPQQMAIQQQQIAAQKQPAYHLFKNIQKLKQSLPKVRAQVQTFDIYYKGEVFQKQVCLQTYREYLLHPSFQIMNMLTDGSKQIYFNVRIKNEIIQISKQFITELYPQKLIQFYAKFVKPTKQDQQPNPVISQMILGHK